MRGRVALVTGAGSGIGAATARRFAAEGASVVLFDLQRAPIEALARELGGVAVAGDASNPEDADRAVRAALERFGAIDSLVTCAGAAVGIGALGELDQKTWQAGVRANLDTCVVTTKAALPALVERRGSVVIVASVGALSSGPRSVSYQTAKSALLGLTRSLAVDYGPLGVRVNAVCPGRTMTAMVEQMNTEFARARGVSPEEMLARFDAPVPLRRTAAPAELASVCLFLASDDASFVTGSVVVADGGAQALNVGVIPFLSTTGPGT